MAEELRRRCGGVTPSMRRSYAVNAEELRVNAEELLRRYVVSGS